MLEPVDFHRVIVCAPSERTVSGARTIIPPAAAFDPAAVRLVPVGRVRAGDTMVGTVQPHYGPLLERLDRAEWVSYFSHTCTPQTADARPFAAGHCGWCAHHAHHGGAGAGHWTVDGCTVYRPDSLVLIVPRELA